MSIESSYGKIGYERGVKNETRVERALDDLGKRGTLPKWLQGYERATLEDDSKGIDGWVNTDVGRIQLQVKSSRKKAREFREAHPNIAVVVVRDNDDEALITNKVISAVGPLRREYLNKRSTY